MVAVRSTSLLQFPSKPAGKILSFVLFRIGGGCIRAAAISIVSIVAGTIRNEIDAFFPTGVVPELLQFL